MACSTHETRHDTTTDIGMGTNVDVSTQLNSTRIDRVDDVVDDDDDNAGTIILSSLTKLATKKRHIMHPHASLYINHFTSRHTYCII